MADQRHVVMPPREPQPGNIRQSRAQMERETGMLQLTAEAWVPAGWLAKAYIIVQRWLPMFFGTCTEEHHVHHCNSQPCQHTGEHTPLLVGGGCSRQHASVLFEVL